MTQQLPRFGQNIVQQPPPNPGDDIPICFGDGDEFCWVWDTTDPDAHLLMGDMPPGDATNVPVVVVGIGIAGQNLALFDGIVFPQYAVVDPDLDAGVMLGFIDDDAPAIQVLGAASGLMVALAAGAPGADVGAVHIWDGTAGAVVANLSSGLVVEGSGDTWISILTPNNSAGGLFFGEPAGQARGIFRYYGSTDTPADTFGFSIAGAERLRYSAGVFAFQEATTITAVGALTLTPTTTVEITTNMNINGNVISEVFDLRGISGSELNLSGNSGVSEPNAQRVIIRTLDPVGNTYVNVAYAVPTATEATPFWAQRADITVPLVGTLDADFLTFRWTPGDDVVTVFVNDGGTIRSVAIGTVT